MKRPLNGSPIRSTALSLIRNGTLHLCTSLVSESCSYTLLHRLQTMIEKSLREVPTCLEDPMGMADAATTQLSVLPQS